MRTTDSAGTRSIASLDGLRAYSIAVVIAGHIFNRFHVASQYWASVLGNSLLGVNIFFVISGYLITLLLFREFNRSGSIGLKRFYFRRAFRILPPCYFYIGVVGVLSVTGLLSITWGQVASALLFLRDYDGATSYALEHLWSLAVEEQFYFIWPFVLVLCLRRDVKTARMAALSGILAAPILRVASYETHVPYLMTHLNYMLHTRIDSLMFGSYVALAEGQPFFEAAYRRVTRYIFPIFLYVMIASPLLVLRFGGFYRYIIDYTIVGFCVALAVLWAVRNPGSTVGRILNWAPVRFIGVISYSLYLWQTVFLHQANHSFFSMYPWNLVWVFACACFSYFLVEKPSMRIRDRIASMAARNERSCA